MDTIRKHLFDDHVSQFWIVSFFSVYVLTICRVSQCASYLRFHELVCVMRFYVA